MAKFSQKLMGKEVGQAPVYAEPHTMDGKAGTDVTNAGYMGGNRLKASEVNISVGNIQRFNFPEPKTTGIKMRGTGAATKGLMSRGPMA